MLNEAVSNGQSIARGQYLGQSSTAVGCGGSAGGAHVHYSLRYNGAFVSINDHDIGGWNVQQGMNYYEGCMVKAGISRCVGSTIYNDGTIGSGGTTGNQCPGTGCTGLDPVTAGCSSDGYTARTVSGYVGSRYYTIDMRYSPRCQSNWAKVTVNGASNLEVQIKKSDGNFATPTYYSMNNNTVIYGNMYYAPTEPVSACARINGSAWICTAAG